MYMINPQGLPTSGGLGVSCAIKQGSTSVEAKIHK